MVEFIIGAAGSGKTTQMFSRIRDSKLRQIMIVPEQYSYEFDKNLYFYLGAERFNELFSLTFTALARELFQKYGDPNRSGEFADELARMILVYKAIAAAEKSPQGLSYFRKRASHSGFAEEIMKLISDLKREGVTPQNLLGKAVFLDDRLADKTNDIASVYLEYERLMEEYGFKDELDNIREAAYIANINRYFKGTGVCIDEFESFNGDQIDMLKVIIADAENVTITLRTDNISAGKHTLFEAVNSTFEKLVGICRDAHKEYTVTKCTQSYRFAVRELAYLSENILRDRKISAENAPEPHELKIFEAKDMYSETEYVCATIKRLISSDDSLRYRDIAVMSNDITRYTDILGAAFKRYEIPVFLSVERSAAHTPIMVFFTSLLDIASAGRFRSEHIFRLLKCGVLEISVTDISMLENYCYKWEIDGDMWCSPFEADDMQLEAVNSIREKVISPLIKLKKRLSRRNMTAGKICSLLYDYLVECHAEESTARLMNELIRRDRDYDASELKRLWECLIDILDSVNDTLGDSETTLSEISRIIRSMIGRIKYSVPPQTLDAVIAASARTARLNSPKVIFILGANEGDFPNQVSLHGLFSEADKQKLSDTGIRVSRPVTDLIADERLIVYKALSSASHKLYLSYPLTDLSGQAKYPASVIDTIIAMFAAPEIRIREDQIPPHYYAATLHSAYYHYMQQRSSGNSSVAAIRSILESVPEYKRRIAHVLSRSGYTQDYRIDKDVMQKLKSFEPLRLSSTSLENFNLCHFKYFCSGFLHLQEYERIELDARVAGELTHECFHGILSSRTKEEFLKMSYDQVCGEIKSTAEKYRQEKLAGDFGKNGRFELIFRKLTERLSDVFIHTQQELMESDFTPDRYELDLRDKHSVILPFGGKYSLSFGGIVDRVDVCKVGENNYVRIIDYKSSRKQITAETLASGINLQMLLYLFSATDKGGLYENFKPAGVLYSPVQISEVKLEEVRDSSKNVGVLNSNLKTSGLVLGNADVVRAMEKDAKGCFVPAKLDASGIPDKRSSCIAESGMTKLRGMAYSALVEMAESLLAGDAEAIPLVRGNEVPCSYCHYVNICDNSRLERFRQPDENKIAEAEAILSEKTDMKEDDE